MQAKGILIDRQTIQNPTDLATAILSYYGIYKQMWILEDDLLTLYRSLDKEMLVPLDETRPSFLARLEREDAHRQNRLYSLDQPLLDRGLSKPFSSYPMIEEALKRGILRLVPESACWKFVRLGLEHLTSLGQEELFKDEPGLVKMFEKNDAANRKNNRILLKNIMSMDFHLQSPLVAPGMYDAKNKEEAVSWGKAFTRTAYVGAAWENDWTIQSKDNIFGNWMSRNFVIDLVRPKAALGIVTQGVRLNPWEFTIADVFQALENKSLLDKLSVFHEEILESEERRRKRAEMAVFLLGLTSGTAAGVATGDLGLAKQALNMGAEAVVYFASHLFKRKSKT